MTGTNGSMTNGAGLLKRKGRDSAVKPKYAESESSDDDVPLVCASTPPSKDLPG
jgi:hypothetical protein